MTYLMKPFILFFCLACTLEIHAQPFQKSQYIDEARWIEVQPYLLPENHPVKSKLDSIFSKSRATSSIDTFSRAGFDYMDLRKWDNVIVAWHQKLKGYIIKAYLDDQIGINDHLAFMTRINGAEAIRDAITAFGYENYFKVPKKWLYMLPDDPPVLPGLQRKMFILVEEDMNLVSSSSNSRMWQKNSSKNFLKALFTLLQTLGLKDSVYITNIPFAKDGKVAFIDTEHHHSWPVKFSRLAKFLNPDMQVYWWSLIYSQGQVE